MTEPNIAHLQEVLAHYQATIPELADHERHLESLSESTSASARNALIDLYEQCYPLLEKAMWSDGSDFAPLLQHYQALYREQGALIQERAQNNVSSDDRHHFILSIPVADRPHHLQACLESIYQLCTLYNYGGNTNGVWDKIQIIVAEDSRDEKNIQRHQALVEEYRQKGLQVLHFGLAEQYELLHALPAQQRAQLGHLLTTQPKEQFYRKGQAANRNLSYLKFLQLTQDKAKTLYYLVDCDQSFCVNRQTESGEEVVYALNYFHIIDRIFRGSDTLLLTGKMVGDPPVSPAVMVVNFLEDVTTFFTRLAELQAEQPCHFHEASKQTADDAAYHDMPGLFGFKFKSATYPYRCRLSGAHDHNACMQDFAQRLNAFFFGEHLTRKTWFNYGEGYRKLSPAHTLYPGNYVANYAGLKYIIPFGHLRLRMSGPTAGCLIAAEIKEQFASCNMPNLHRRITATGVSDAFRAGVELGQQNIDLSNEFERQFFGDLMLFSTEELLKKADINQPFDKEMLVTLVDQKETELLALYQQKHDAIVDKSRQLHELVFNAEHWWLGATDAMQQVRTFIDNINRNFGEQAQAWMQIHSDEHRAQRKQEIIDALMQYRTERYAWDALF